MLLGFGFCVSALAQTPAAKTPVAQSPVVPCSSFYVGLGGKLQLDGLRNAGRLRQGDVANIPEWNARLHRGCGGTGDRRHADGIAFRTFGSGRVLPALRERPLVMGARFSYSYLNTESTVENVTVPQVGTFTNVATKKTTPFIGVAVAKSYQTRLQHQLQLIPFIGRSFENVLHPADCTDSKGKAQQPD